MSLKNMNDLLSEVIRDLNDAERQLSGAMSELSGKTSIETLKNNLKDRAQEVQKQKERLNQVLNTLKIESNGVTSTGMNELIGEAKELVNKGESAEVKDAALIYSVQKIIHYKIAAYGSACAFAEAMGKKEISEILEKTLEEEKKADKKLTEIAIKEA